MNHRARWFGRGCVASPHYLASAAGLAVLESGGNALDAALATNLTLGVVTPYLCGFGGDLFAMVWDGSLHAYAGAGRAPEKASPDAAGEATMPAFGPKTVTVPGAAEAWFALLERFGSRSFGEVSERALELAREGFVITDRGAAAMSLSARAYDGPWSAVWHETYGASVKSGRRFLQPALAKTIETLAAGGPSAYYTGDIADAICAATQGWLEPADLAAHRGEWVVPLRTAFCGVEVHEMPPPTQGVAALQALAIAEKLGIGPPDGPLRQHLLVEAMKIALADRDRYLTDPAHMTVAPAQLFASGRAASLAAGVDAASAAPFPPGRPALGGTAYMCAADADGMLVSLIQSNYVGFGSGVTVPGWGINLQNRGSYFSLDPAHANVIAPRKRTAHTLIPAMAMRDGRPWLVFGSMGGDGQAQTHLQLLAHIAKDGADVQHAVSAPRWRVSTQDGSVTAESRFPDDVVAGLRKRGHDVTVGRPFEWSSMGHAHAIQLGPDGYAAASDPRAEGAALGL